MTGNDRTAVLAAHPFRMTDRQMSYDDIDDHCFEEAVRWHARLRGEDDPALYREHADWLATDVRHGKAMEEAEALFGALKTIASATPKIAATRRGRARRMRFAAAAAVVLAAGTAVITQLTQHDVLTRVGETRLVTLADGTEVTLGPDTAIDVDLRPHERRITLVKGEALFHVCHDAARPFLVDAGAGHTRVLGTVFDVERTTDGVRVGVLEGRVAVGDSRGEALQLVADEAAAIDATGVHALARNEAAAQVAWTKGQWVFYRRPLADVVARIGRSRHGVILLRGRALQAPPVSGAFDAHAPDAALDSLVSALNLGRVDLGPWLTVVY
jgi:transmembrane sensor